MKIARSQLLEPGGLGDRELERTLDRVMHHTVDHADLYFQATRYESWALEDGIVKEASHNIEQGVGVRAVSGEKTGFAYSDEIAFDALTHAAGAARAIARSGSGAAVQAWQGARRDLRLYAPEDPLQSIS